MRLLMLICVIVPLSCISQQDPMPISPMIYSVPSPLQTMQLLADTDVEFDRSMLNPPDSAEKYNTTYLATLNLGVYEADVSYLIAYNRLLSKTDLEPLQLLEEEIGQGESGVFHREFMASMGRNKDNEDSLQILFSEACRNVDAYWKDNDMPEISAMIIVGGWVESMYLMTSAAVADTSDLLRERVAEQRYSLENLIAMLSEYLDYDGIAGLHNALTELQVEFEDVEILYDYGEPEAIVRNNTTIIITGGSTITITDETLNSIYDKILEIREGIVN